MNHARTAGRKLEKFLPVFFCSSRMVLDAGDFRPNPFHLFRAG
jgi:hypothetical protein